MKRFTQSVPFSAPFYALFTLLSLLLAAMVLSACSGKSGAGVPDGGASGLDAGLPAAPYPAGPYGSGKGSVIKNATFYGYANVAASQKLKFISLGDYFNPDGTKLTDTGAPLTALLVAVGAVWCGPCVLEAGSLPAVANKFMPAGIQFVQDLYQGADSTTGNAATQAELDAWITSHALPFPVFIDPAKKLAPYFDVGSLPFIMLVDTRTMTNVAEETGFGGQDMLEAFICQNAPQKPSVCP
jgi:hypothetical protein